MEPATSAAGAPLAPPVLVFSAHPSQIPWSVTAPMAQGVATRAVAERDDDEQTPSAVEVTTLHQTLQRTRLSVGANGVLQQSRTVSDVPYSPVSSQDCKRHAYSPTRSHRSVT